MVFARNAAMGLNRYADRKMDAMNPRTAGREIPTGAVRPASALTFSLVNSALFIAATYLLKLRLQYVV